jgi:hypothetical protein
VRAVAMMLDLYALADASSKAFIWTGSTWAGFFTKVPSVVAVGSTSTQGSL